MSFRRCWTCGAQPASHPGARGPPAGPVNDGHSEDVANLLKRQLPVFHNILFLSCSSAEQVNIIQLGANHVPPQGQRGQAEKRGPRGSRKCQGTAAH